MLDFTELVYFVYSNITSIKQRGFSYLIPNAAKLRSKSAFGTRIGMTSGVKVVELPSVID